MPDKEYLDSLLIWEDANTYQPLGYFTVVETQEVLNNYFYDGTHLRATIEEEGIIIKKDGVPVSGISLLIGPDGEHYVRKLDVVIYVYLGC